MNEDFVPFELAKKIKEKGFPQYTEKSYFVGDHEKRMCSIGTFLHTHTQNTAHLIAAPTISQALKWLREEHVFHVEILREKYKGWQYFIQLSDASYTGHGSNYDSYEAAALAGITYCLDNLI